MPKHSTYLTREKLKAIEPYLQPKNYTRNFITETKNLAEILFDITRGETIISFLGTRCTHLRLNGLSILFIKKIESVLINQTREEFVTHYNSLEEKELDVEDLDVIETYDRLPTLVSIHDRLSIEVRILLRILSLNDFYFIVRFLNDLTEKGCD